MEFKKACIYCGTAEELSDSDIIPDALTNATFLYYCLFVIGHSADIQTFDDLSSHMKDKFSEGTIEIDENTTRLFLDEIFATEDYFPLIKKGAEIVKNWEYN